MKLTEEQKQLIVDEMRLLAIINDRLAEHTYVGIIRTLELLDVDNIEELIQKSTKGIQWNS